MKYYYNSHSFTHRITNMMLMKHLIVINVENSYLHFYFIFFFI